MCPNIRYAQFLNANGSGFRNAAFAPLVGVGEGGTNGSLNGRCLSVELQRTENAVAKKRYNVSFFRFLAFFGRSLLFGNAGAQATFVLLSRSPLSSVALMMFGISYPCHLNPANAVLQLHEEDAGRSTVCQKSRADLRCIQCHVNSWTLDAPKVSCLFWTNGTFFRHLCMNQLSIKGGDVPQMRHFENGLNAPLMLDHVFTAFVSCISQQVGMLSAPWEGQDTQLINGAHRMKHIFT